MRPFACGFLFEKGLQDSSVSPISATWRESLSHASMVIEPRQHPDIPGSIHRTIGHKAFKQASHSDTQSASWDFGQRGGFAPSDFLENSDDSGLMISLAKCNDPLKIR